jgi:hypothetical protein
VPVPTSRTRSPPLESERLDRERDDVRLRDRLPGLDRQRRILVGKLGECFRDEVLPRHAAEGLEQARVVDAATGELELDHALPIIGGIDPEARLERCS